MNNNDVIVSVGMGPGQLEFIQRLSAKGYSIVAFGKGKNSNEAVSLCSYTAEIDTRDFQSAVKWIDSLPVNVIGVGSFAGGAAVTTVQKLANYYRVPTSVPDELVVGSDKLLQQKLYNDFGLSTIKTWKVKDLSVIQVNELNEESFIIKPAVGRGSEGITIISKETLIKLLNNSELKDEDVIQVVRKGREYRCVIIIQAGSLKLLAPILRTSYRDTVFLGILRYSDIDYDRLVRFINEFSEKTKLVNTIIKADIIVSEKSIDVIEMDIGVGGGSYYKKFISKIYDRDLMDEYISLITNEDIKEFLPKRPNFRMDYVFNHYPTPITYDLNECYRVYEKKLGSCELQTNVLHPETKGGFTSNADFIFTVMYDSTDGNDNFIADEIANSELFYR